MLSSTAHAGRYRAAAVGAIVGGLLRLAIAAAFAITGLGAAGDLPYGTFSRLTFLPSAALMLGMTALYGAVAHLLPRTGRLGVLVSLVGLVMSTVGELGGQWLAFPRSGNFLIAPGAILTMSGLAAFAATARRSGLPSGLSVWAFVIALFPVGFFPLAVGIHVVAGGAFPPSLDDNYFRVLYVIVGLLWILFGAVLLGESKRHRERRLRESV
ncbi:MAG: hypothetical protein ACE5HP_10905 [Gemmatimonadota bacterium]